MKFEKKLIALCMFALTLGIVTVLPMTYFLSGVDLQAQAKQMCDPNVYSVAVYPDSTTLLTGYGDSAFIDIDVTYGIHSMFNFKDIDAKIEVYNYHVYSDQTSIANITHTIAITKDVPDPNSPSGFTSGIMDRSREKNTYTFADGSIFDITGVIGYVENSRLSGIIYDQGPTDDLYPMHDAILISASKGERSAQALYSVRSAQKVYVDVTMTLSVTYKHPNNSGASSIITTTSTNNDVLFHAELTKMADGSFRYAIEKTNTSNNNSFAPDNSSIPPDDSNMPSNIIKLPSDVFTVEPSAMTLLSKVFATSAVFQKSITLQEDIVAG